MSGPERNSVRYERRDVNARIFVYIAMGACGAALLIHSGLGALFNFYRDQEDRRDTPASALIKAASQLPPEPRLERNPGEALQSLRRSQEARLDGYHWLDRQAQTVQIPLSRAIELTLERGLPDWQPKDSKTDQNDPGGKP